MPQIGHDPGLGVGMVNVVLFAFLPFWRQVWGVARMPMFLGRNLPGLLQVPLLPPQPYMDIWLVGHPDVWPGAKLKAFRDMHKADLRPRKSEFLG